MKEEVEKVKARLKTKFVFDNVTFCDNVSHKPFHFARLKRKTGE
jgi:hypothetical protein